MSEEAKKETIDRLVEIEKKLAKIERDSKIGLEDQLFFGVVVSLVLFFIALPFTELSSLFQNVFLFSPETALDLSTTIRNAFVSILLISVMLRYYGAIKPHKGARLLSILCLLFSLDIFLLNFLPTLTLNLSIEIKPIAIPISYIVLIFIYVAMGKYVEPKIIKFYATKGLVSKKYAYPIVSLLFASLACSIYLTIATLFISFFVFQHESTQIEITVSYLVFSFIFLGLGYFLFLRRNKIIKIKNPFK